MQILLANAKIMYHPDDVGALPAGMATTAPAFQHVADRLAAEMARHDVAQMAKQLDCGRTLAAENLQRYREFGTSKTMPALMAYNGQAYKHLLAKTLDARALSFAQQHLWITCFLYGLLRPTDAIVPYRMEHCVALEATGDKPVNQFWRDTLTDFLIDSVKADDGILLHLSTEEYEHLFHWRRVEHEVRVVKPWFYVRKGGKLAVQSVWAKSCRGAMVRYVLNNHIVNPAELDSFSHEGFEFASGLGDANNPHFVREEL